MPKWHARCFEVLMFVCFAAGVASSVSSGLQFDAQIRRTLNPTG